MLTIKTTYEEITNLLTAMEYLKDLLQTTDVSDDFASDTDENVTAWDLINDQSLIQTLRQEIKD